MPFSIFRTNTSGRIDKNVIKSISILEIGCALGAHTGPGTLDVGIQEHLSI